MGISRFEFKPEADSHTVAAVIAAVLQFYQEDEEEIIEKPYIHRKNKGWKNICLQENCWGLSKFRY